MEEDIIWHGSEQTFTESQLNAAEMLRNDYWAIVGLFIMNTQTYRGGDYVIHHIDGDHTNNHPSNLMLIARNAHTQLHWENLNDVDFIVRCKGISDSRTPSVRLAIGKGQVAWRASISAEEYEELMQNYSKGQGGKRIKGREFIETCPNSFNLKEFNKFAGFSDIDQARKLLRKWINDGDVRVISKNKYGAFTYLSLICELL